MSEVPEELRYLESHEWVRVDGDTATIGITDFAQDQLTDVVYVELAAKGTHLKRGESFGTVESVKSVSDMYAPVSGEVLEANALLEKEPDTVNVDPYGKGWMIRVRLADAADVESLLDAKAYRTRIGEA